MGEFLKDFDCIERVHFPSLCYHSLIFIAGSVYCNHEKWAKKAGCGS